MSVTRFLKRKLLWVFLLCIVLSACTGNPTLPLTAAPETSTPLRTLTPAPEIVSAPADTPRPSQTPGATWSMRTDWFKSGETLTATAIYSYPGQTASWRATRGAGAYRGTLTIADLAEFPGLCEDYWLYGGAFSPDGNWLATLCERYGAYETLEVINRNGTRWVVYFKDYLADGGEAGLPIGGLYPRYWSQDGKYLYFTPKIEFDGGGTCHYEFGVQALARITLEDGAVSTILPILDDDYWYHVSFSPSGRRIVFAESQRSMTILDLLTGERISLDDSDRPTGNFWWSPDGLNLVYTICQVSEDYRSVARSAVKVFSTQSGVITTILQVQNNFLSIEGWDKNDILKIGVYKRSFYYSYRPLEYRFYNWSTGQFVTSTLTPTP